MEIMATKQPFQVLATCCKWQVFLLLIAEAIIILILSNTWNQSLALKGLNLFFRTDGSSNDNFIVNFTYEERLARFESALNHFCTNLEKVGNRTLKHISNYTRQPTHKGHAKLFSKDKHFFARLSNYSNVETVFMRENFKNMTHYLEKKYYHFSCNDCQLLNKNRPDEKNISSHFYNITCQDSMSDMLVGRPLQPNVLNLGLPEGYSFSDNPIWTYINVIQNGLVDPEGDIRTDSWTMIPQRCDYNKSYNVKKQAKYPVYDELFVISQTYGIAFYHGTVENVARITPYLPFLRKYPHIKIHCYRRSIPILKLLDIPQLQNRTVSGVVRAHVVYSPAGIPCGRPTFFGTQYLSFLLRHKASQISPSKKRNLIILIKRSALRWFNHHDKILQMLQQEGSAKGLEVKVFGDRPVLDLKTTMDMFYRAVMVVAPHGAGESNLMYSQPGTVIIEGLWYQTKTNSIILCYKDMVQMLGLRFHGLAYKHQCMDITEEHIRKPVKFFLQNLKFII